MDNQVKRAMMVVLCLLLTAAVAEAQVLRNVEVSALLKKKVKGQKEPVGQPLAGAHILGFFEASQADRIFKRIQQDCYKMPSGDEISRELEDYSDYCDVYETTDNEGRAILQMPLDGYLICIPRSCDPVKKQEVKSNAFCEIVIDAEIVQQLNDVQVEGRRKQVEWKPGKSPRVGNRITQVPMPYPIPSELAKDNGRYGMAIHFIGLADRDTLCNWRPFLKDGGEFHDTQYRRMGYDRIDGVNIRHDKLGRFVSRYALEDHEADTIMYSWDLMLPNGKYYRALADIWAEDYNGKFYRDTVELFDGYSPQPLRFLDFKIDDVPIDASRYEMKGKMDEHESNLTLHFQFLNGKAELDTNDSINQIEQQKLLDEFLPAYQDPNNSRFTVRLVGKASPEGSYATNSRLSAERAHTIAEWLALASGFQGSHTESVVATWNEVADTLQQMGDWDKAEEIRAIASRYKGFEQQNNRVAALPYYNYLKDKILPKFRVVNFSFNYIIKRPLKREEVIRNYETDPAYRRMTKSGYEYMFLFDYLKDRTPELEEQARQAYQNIRETADKPRPWPLAAYHYSRCLTRKKRPDVDILGPYFHKEYGPNSERIDENFRKQWWNDEALAVAEIGAYCAQGNYGAANFIVANYLPETPKFERLRLFLECYDNHYTEKKVMDAVAATSSFNKAVIYAAQDEEADTMNLRYLRAAWQLLGDTAQVSANDVRVPYLRGSVGYRIFKAKSTKTFYDGRHFTPKRAFNEEEEKRKLKEELPYESDWTIAAILEEARDEFNRQNADESVYWGYDIIRACLLDASYVETLKYDGYFDKSFRKAFNFFWKGLKEGTDIYELQERWDKLSIEEKVG